MHRAVPLSILTVSKCRTTSYYSEPATKKNVNPTRAAHTHTHTHTHSLTHTHVAHTMSRLDQKGSM